MRNKKSDLNAISTQYFLAFATIIEAFIFMKICLLRSRIKNRLHGKLYFS
jgi:hypothetical protein